MKEDLLFQWEYTTDIQKPDNLLLLKVKETLTKLSNSSKVTVVNREFN